MDGSIDAGKVFIAARPEWETGETTMLSPLPASVTPRALSFALGQVARPLVERLSEGMSPLIESLNWVKGYCPICGTMPEFAFLRGDGGQRWLRCASCGHEWRFTRLICPFCESDNQEDFEIYFVEDRAHEKIEVCLGCKRYVLTVDSRDRSGTEIAHEVAAVGLMHLDVIAQRKGFHPVAVCLWNTVEVSALSEGESRAPRM